jgi:hypothetical protein
MMMMMVMMVREANHNRPDSVQNIVSQQFVLKNKKGQNTFFSETLVYTHPTPHIQFNTKVNPLTRWIYFQYKSIQCIDPYFELHNNLL